MTEFASSDIQIVNSIHFNIILQAQSLAVLSIPSAVVPKCTWWLIREFGLSQKTETLGHRTFTSFLVDDDGLSLICKTDALDVLHYLLRPEEFTLSPFAWKAFVIQLTGSAVEVPGAVYCLANSLSSQGLSILHISTFESEIFLVQEPDLEKACVILREFEDPVKTTELLELACHASNDRTISNETICNVQTPRLDTIKAISNENESTDAEESVHALRLSKDGTSSLHVIDEPEEGASHDNEEENENLDLDMSWIAPQAKSIIRRNLSEQQLLNSQSGNHHLISSAPSKTKFDEGFTLCVLPYSVRIAKCGIEQWRRYSHIMVNMLLFDERFSPVAKRYENYPQHSMSDYSLGSLTADSTPVTTSESRRTLPKGKKEDTDRANFMWGVWCYDEEVTFLIGENELDQFPLDDLDLSPQQWRVIKLCGRPIAFNETGVVCAMSRIDTNIPSLNISTAITNCTLVPEELLEQTASGLSNALNCPVQYTPAYGEQ